MRTRAFLRVTFAIAAAGCIVSTASSSPVKPQPPQAHAHREAIQILSFPNDNCANAIAIPSTFPFTTSQSTLGASDEAGEPASTCTLSSNSVWYTIGPFGTAQTVSLDTLGSDYDTTMQVVTGACGSQVVVACNDDIDFPTYPQSRITFQVAPATLYYVQLAGYKGATGSLVLNANSGATIPTLGAKGMAALALLLAGVAILVLRLRN